MKLNFKVPAFLKPYLEKLRPIAKHHYFIVTVLLFSGVALAIFLVNETLNSPSDEDYRTRQSQSTIGVKFNRAAQDTIDKIKSLQKSTDPAKANAPFPPGRINPFAE